MFFFFDKLKPVMHSSSLQLGITMFRVTLRYLLAVISITLDKCVISHQHNNQTCPPEPTESKRPNALQAAPDVSYHLFTGVTVWFLH